VRAPNARLWRHNQLVSLAHGKWKVTIKTPLGDRSGVLELQVDGSKVTGSLSDGERHVQIMDGKINGNQLTWSAKLEKPMRLTFKFNAVVTADRISGSARNLLGSGTFTGVRA
jgi:carbon-monoxide dehydrogenase large subunit